MKKILVIGSCGAGKSTLAKKISEELDIPLIALDKLYWQPGWTRTPRQEWREKVAELVKGDSWVMDGNYQNTFDIRFPSCDTVVFLDIKPSFCFYRIWKRRILKNRVDELNNCSEKIDFRLMKRVLWDYPRKGRKRILEQLQLHKDKKLIVIKSFGYSDSIKDLLKK